MTGMLAVTREKGLYLCADITAQTWAQLGDDVPGLKYAAFDTSDPGAGIIAHDGANAYFFNPRTDSDWSTILTQAQIIAATGKVSFTIWSVAISPVTGYYYVAGADPLTDRYNRVFRSVNGGASWTNVQLTGLQNRGAPGIVTGNTDGDFVAVAEIAGSTLTRSTVSTNGGTSYTQYNMAGFGGWEPLLFIDPNNDDILYAGTAGPVLSKSTNGGQTWATAYNVAGPVRNSNQSWLWIDPDNSDRIYFTYNDKLYYTQNAWVTPVAQALPNSYVNYNALTGEDNVLFLGRAAAEAGESDSIYRTDNNGVSLTAWSGSDAGNPNTTASIPYTADGITWGGLAVFTDAIAISAVTISGNRTVPECLTLTLTASVTPPAFAPYVTWQWSTDGLVSGQGTATAIYRWHDARAAYPQVLATYGTTTLKAQHTVTVLHNPQCLHYHEDLLTVEVHA